MACAPPLLPSTDRLLRGVQSALTELDLSDRTDLQHTIGMVQMVIGHLRQRQDVSTLALLYADCAAFLNKFSQRVLPSHSPLPDIMLATEHDAALLEITAIFAALRDATTEAGRSRLALSDPFWRQTQALELRFFESATPSPVTIPKSQPLTRVAFEAYLLGKFPGMFAGVAAFHRLVGGFQKETILVDVKRVAGYVESIVIRAEKHDRFVKMTASEIIDEYAIVQAMWEKGVPVAEPLWLESDEGLLGRRFMVSRRAAGANTGSAYGDSSQFPPALVRSFLATLAKIHALSIDAKILATKLGHWENWATLADNTRAEIAAWRHQIWLNPASASPSFARIFDWLESNVPTDEGRACVIHNDYGPHNIMVEGDTVTAVLDWEVPRIGDPAEDLSFFIQCAGSAIDREEAFSLYQEISGNRISRFRMAYWNVMSVAKVLVSTVSANAMYQQTDPALIDWVQMPLLAHAAYQPMVEDRIAAADALRGQ